MIYVKDGIVFECDTDIDEKEAAAYIQRGIDMYGDYLNEIHAEIDGDEVDLKYYYTERTPFERIRRITGYLVGTLDRFNDAKRAEEHDRVKHNVKE